MIYRVAPVYGKKNPLVYLSICSTVGSISVMAVKAFGIALKLTFAGNNQFTHPSTYVFMIITAVCILTQMNYFNKALSQFPTNMWVSKFKFRKTIETQLTCSVVSTLCTTSHSPPLPFAPRSSSSRASTPPNQSPPSHSFVVSWSPSPEFTYST